MGVDPDDLRLKALVSTLPFQCLFVCPSEPTMPSQKLSLVGCSAGQTLMMDPGVRTIS